MKSHECYCGRELFAGAVKCEQCIKALARRNSGKRSHARRTETVDRKFIACPFEKYLSQIFARAE